MRTKAKKNVVRLGRQIVSRTEEVRDALWEASAPLIGTVVVLGLLAFLWSAPIWMVSQRAAAMHPALTAKERLDGENATRTTLVQLVGGAIVLVGSWIAFRNVKAVERNIEIAQDSQITARYTQAIEQLGSDKPEVRLGGIFALERIARDSERDHGPIMEVFASYVRSHRPATGERTGTAVSPEVQAVMTVMGRRDWGHEIGGNRIDLGGIDLRGLNLRKAYLGDISFDRANLEGVDLTGTDLDGAFFVDADLQFTKMQGLDLSGIDLKGAKLAKAILVGCDLRAAVNLKAAQVSAAHFDRKTLVSEDMRQELVAIWHRENDSVPKELVDTDQAAALGIQVVHPQAAPTTKIDQV